MTCTYAVCPGTCLVVRDVQEMTRVTFVTWWSIVLSLLNSRASCGVLRNQIHMIMILIQWRAMVAIVEGCHSGALPGSE
eukprot:COSAG01_NODE_1802_length_9198_cov_288.767447_1_plen_79_part_00